MSPSPTLVFTSDTQTLFGVNAPYAGWVEESNQRWSLRSRRWLRHSFRSHSIVAHLQGLNENHGSSIYHSFQLKAEKRYTSKPIHAGF